MSSWSKNDLLGIVIDPVNESQFTSDLTLVDFDRSNPFEARYAAVKLLFPHSTTTVVNPVRQARQANATIVR
jgi:hypothetical protein